MSIKQEIKQAERQSFALNFKDGLWDILFGLIFATMVFRSILVPLGYSVTVSYLPMVATMVLGIWLYSYLKRVVVAPRLGMVKAGPGRNSSHRNLLLVAVALQVITLIIFVLGMQGKLQGAPTGIVEAGFAVGIFGFFAFMGYLAQAPRLAFYGLTFASAILAQMYIGDDTWFDGLPNLVFGGVLVIVGAFVLRRFMQDYPVVQGEMENV